jgi:phenylalanyl-tRNA synthetase beta chain
MEVTGEMRVPLSWLKEFVHWDLSTEALAERLTLGGLEVKAIDKIGAEWDPTKVFVGRVVGVRQHPDADRLVLVTVDYGAGAPLEVVTGAPNLHVGDVGQKVVFATVGARLIDGHSETLRYTTLKKGKIRGVASEGMVCSEKELGISEAHEGILLLPDDAPSGQPFQAYWGDTVLDLDLTPNLARCFSIAGVAREVAALLDVSAKLPDYELLAGGAPIAGQLAIEIADTDLCPRYSAALIKNVTIAPSPQWLQRRLLLAGMRPINNIVDITNYVMLELGQPLHAFDYRLVRPRPGGGEPTIIVRRAQKGERMKTLDDVERAFSDDMLLITDGGGPVAVAGVMGGLESEISDATADILLESANFAFISVRRTSAECKIPSEAATRFGRGVDPELTLVALRRAAGLMQSLAGGQVAEGFADCYPRPATTKVIDFPVSEVDRLLGISLSAAEIGNLLGRLGFACQTVPGDAVVRITVPSHRLDVAIPADIVEEVARIYGYDRLPDTLIAEQMPTLTENRELALEERVRDILVGCGLTETITYSLTNLESVARLTPGGPAPASDDYVRLANPLSREYEYLRRTLLNTTLENVARNLRFVERVAVFEVAHVYLPQEGQELPAEPTYLSVALTGPREARSWLAGESAACDFYDLKGVAEQVCVGLGVADVVYAATEHPSFRPGRVASLAVGDEALGVLGQVHPAVTAAFDLEDRAVYLLEVNLTALLALAQPTKRFTPISRMPALKMDLALVVEQSVAPDALEAAIRQSGGDLLVDVVLFDVYRGEQLGAGKKSLAYSLTFQSPDKTLDSAQANKTRDRIVRALQAQFGAEIRS